MLAKLIIKAHTGHVFYVSSMCCSVCIKLAAYWIEVDRRIRPSTCRDFMAVVYRSLNIYALLWKVAWLLGLNPLLKLPLPKSMYYLANLCMKPCQWVYWFLTSVWSLQTVRHYHGHLSACYALDLHPTIDILVTCGRDATVRVRQLCVCACTCLWVNKCQNIGLWLCVAICF